MSKVKDKEKQVEVYKMIRTLMQEADSAAFEMMTSGVVKLLSGDPESTEFCAYFRQNYSANARFWTYCYRVNSGLDTNMHIERIHNTIQYIYLHAKRVKRLDKAIHALMSFLKDKLSDRLIVLHEGKSTSKLEIIRKRHKSSFELNQDLVVKEENGWRIPS